MGILEFCGKDDFEMKTGMYLFHLNNLVKVYFKNMLAFLYAKLWNNADGLDMCEIS